MHSGYIYIYIELLIYAEEVKELFFFYERYIYHTQSTKLKFIALYRCEKSNIDIY